MKRVTILIFVVAFFSCACTAKRWIQTPVIEEQNVLVSLEHYMEGEQIIPQDYDHPKTISLQDTVKLLAGQIYIDEGGLFGKKTEKPVFQNVEIERLAPAIADAFSKATPDQRIVFTSFNRGKALLFTKTRKTEGVLFITPENQINLAFGLINFEVDPDDVNELTDSLNRIDPLKLNISGTPLIPNPSYASHHMLENGEPSPMWIIADIKKLQAAPVTVPASQPAKTETDESSMVTANDGKMQSKPALPSPQDDQKEQIKNNLTYIKELFEEGLITKEEYEVKKKEILDTIK